MIEPAGVIKAHAGLADMKTEHVGLRGVMIAPNDHAGTKIAHVGLMGMAGYVRAGLKTVYLVVLPPLQHGLERQGGLTGHGWASWRCEHQKVVR